MEAHEDGDRTNDPRTHAGVVLAVDDDATTSGGSKPVHWLSGDAVDR